jgi:lipopolysaccharide transport system permease protein
VDLEQNQHWTSVLTPVKRFSFVSLKECRGYGALVRLLVIRNLRTHYFQTLLGPLWLVVKPLITAVVFFMVFNRIARISTDGTPAILFYFSGIILWNFFTHIVTSLSRTFSSNQHLFSRIYFPRIVMPAADTLTHTFQFALQFILLLVLYGYISLTHHSVPGMLVSAIITVPAAFTGTLLAGAGIGLIGASLVTTFRDVNYMMAYGLQMWFYATPIIYPVSKIPEYLRNFYLMNPMVSMIELFRYPLSGVLSVSQGQLTVHFLISSLLFITGIMLFSHTEKSCVDRV